MAGAHIDTRYIQTDKQQFTGLPTKDDMHNILYLVSYILYLISHPKYRSTGRPMMAEGPIRLC